MSTEIVPATQEEVFGLIDGIVPPDKMRYVSDYICKAAHVWFWNVDGKVAVAWGLIPLTLLSNQAYIWLYTTDAHPGNEFLFIRKSKIELEKMQALYPSIIGHVMENNERGIRWLKWLGAALGSVDSKGLIPFEIRRKNG